MSDILFQIGQFVIKTISDLGYPGVFLLMTAESANIPVPSEVIMPFSGYLVLLGRFNFWLAVLVGAAGNLFGSVISYYLGFYGGRPLVEKYGKYFFISQEDLERGTKWFNKYGVSVALFSRVLPVARTFISLPAGISKIKLLPFAFYTFVGSFIWSIFLTWIGFKLGENWQHIEVYFRKSDYLIVAFALLVLVLWIWKHVHKSRV